VRALFEQRLLPVASGVGAAFVALWLHTFRSFTTPRSLFDCLVDFNALAPLDSRLSGSQRNANVSRTRTQVCFVLASDFLADSELLFADSRSSCWPRRRLPTRSRSGTAYGAAADQENAQVLRRRARSEEDAAAARLQLGRGRAADGAGGAR
jgi:hypothetical protein